MSLRLRLVGSLVVLVALGLLAFGWGTVRVFAEVEYRRLDRQLDAAADVVVASLDGPTFGVAGDGPGGPGSAGPGGPGRDRGPSGRGEPPVTLAPGTYAELRDVDGEVVATRRFQTSGDVPDLAPLVDGDAGPATVGSMEGDTEWRALSRSVEDGRVLLVAAPTSIVGESVTRLLTIELAAGTVLLALLAIGGALVLRRGLRPLEEIAAATSTIGAGDLDRRVPHAGTDTEVGQVAAAVNRMLDDLELAFHERERVEARLRRFIADASHELRTPLTSIRGFAELFRLGVDSPHVDLETAMRRIEEESARMARLVDDLLALARLDDAVPVAPVEVDLAVIAADACSDAVAADPSRPVTLDASGPVPVAADADQLRQALANLVTNALRHTPTGTPIEVVARTDGDHAELVVRDHGEGLTEEALAHAFDRFWQADRARVGTGSGLGLAITAAIAVAHGGSVRAGNHPDGGARFVISLPRRPQHPGAGP